MKVCVIGFNSAPETGFPVTVQWHDDRGDRKWFACKSMEEAEAQAKENGFTHASDPTKRGRRAIRKL